MNFYEKALFVKADVAAPLCGERDCSLPFALCFYSHSRGALFLVARCIIGSVFSSQRRCNLRSGLPSSGWTKFAWRSRLMLDQKRVRATSAVAVRHALGSPSRCSAMFTSSLCSPEPSPLFKPPPSIGADARRRAARRVLL